MKNKLIDIFNLTLLIGLIASCSETNFNRFSQADTSVPETESLIFENFNPSLNSEVTASQLEQRNFYLNSASTSSRANLISNTTPLFRSSTGSRSFFPIATESLQSRLEISLSNRQVTLYYGNIPIRSYPIAIGRAGWETPSGTFEVQQMRKNPVWIHPFTNERISTNDSRNPLGSRWIGFWTDGHVWIGLHGTSNPESVGEAVSHGCIRMHNNDIEEIFAQIEMGTTVTVVQ